MSVSFFIILCFFFFVFFCFVLFLPRFLARRIVIVGTGDWDFAVEYSSTPPGLFFLRFCSYIYIFILLS
jgi:hypothetical protein